MNIKEAKQEIINTIQAYLLKDETGAYEIPIERQRPILLIGAPGIGKTAIIEQIARECNINLVSYTITHHTRQSAIGLPFISKREYGGKPYSVTEYTMSEIISAIYEQIEKTGISEGILFLDEINCVSETLAPTMLQFLQYKTFGSHRIPEGFIIVTAGNPPQYNKSVRDFDIVTLDRLKYMECEEDFGVWKEYAYRVGIHGAVLAYLEIKKENFYLIRTELEGRSFVTARGWEDLSRTLEVYEKLNLPVTERLVAQFVQNQEIAKDFAIYYELYQKYKTVYRIWDILKGSFPEDTEGLKKAPFDEKLSLLGLLIDSLNQQFRAYVQNLERQRGVFEQLQFLKKDLAAEKGSADEILKKLIAGKTCLFEKNKQSKMMGKEEEKTTALVLLELEDYLKMLTLGADEDEKASAGQREFEKISRRFAENEAKRQEEIIRIGKALSNVFEFLVRTFGEGQEVVIFLSELSAGYYSMRFLSECGNEAYEKYNRLLLLKDRRQSMKKEVEEFLLK